MSLVDANVVLRYLLDDHAELSPKAAEILERPAVGSMDSGQMTAGMTGLSELPYSIFVFVLTL